MILFYKKRQSLLNKTSSEQVIGPDSCVLLKSFFFLFLEIKKKEKNFLLREKDEMNTAIVQFPKLTNSNYQV